MIETYNNFQEKKSQLFDEIGDHAVGALATSFNGKPYVRSVSCIIIDENVYFQTDKNMNKVTQIYKNPFVAICFKHIQIQGECEELCHPLHNSNTQFINLFKRYYPHAAQLYSYIENEHVYQITPTRIETWKYIEGEPYQELFDINSEIYRLKKYNL